MLNIIFFLTKISLIQYQTMPNCDDIRFISAFAGQRFLGENLAGLSVNAIQVLHLIGVSKVVGDTRVLFQVRILCVHLYID